jgi:hypothetical protein
MEVGLAHSVLVQIRTSLWAPSAGRAAMSLSSRSCVADLSAIGGRSMVRTEFLRRTASRQGMILPRGYGTVVMEGPWHSRSIARQ